jgi:hypothetical protein
MVVLIIINFTIRGIGNICMYIYYGASRKVAGLIPDGVTGFLNLPNFCSRTMALDVTAICEPIV